MQLHKTLLIAGITLAAFVPTLVLSTLFGLRQDWGQAVRALVAAQAGLAIALSSLAPLTMLFYASTRDYGQALLFNGLMFAITYRIDSVFRMSVSGFLSIIIRSASLPGSIEPMSPSRPR